MNPNHLAAVWVDGEGEDYRVPAFATGYPIAPGLVLTVAHIFKTGWSKVTVQIPNVQDSISCMDQSRDNRPILVWNGREHDTGGLDAALIACTLPKGVGEFASFLDAAPTSLSRFFGYGYPEFARPVQKPESPFDPKGTFAPPQDCLEFELTCDEKYLVPKKWSGISGGPVFVAPTNQLAAILSGIRHHGGRSDSCGQEVTPVQRLCGVPAWKIFHDPHFQEIWREAQNSEVARFQQDDDGWFTRLASRIVPILLRHSCEVLQSEFESCFGENLRTEDGDALKSQIQRLVRDRSLNRSLPGDIVSLRNVCEEFDLFDAADAFDRLLTSLIPAMLKPDERMKIERLLNASGTARIVVSCEAGAAIKVAACGRKKLDDDSLNVWGGDIKKWAGPNGKPLTFLPPGEVKHESMAVAIFMELVKDELPADERPEVRKLRDEIRSEKPAAKVVQNSVDYCVGRKDFVNSRLKERERNRGISFCVYSSATLLGRQASEVARTELKKAVDLVKSWLPAMRFLEITLDNPPQEEGAAVEQLEQLHEYRRRKNGK